MSRPVLRVARATLAESMNWTASADTAWSDAQVDGILDGGDDGETDAALLRRWDAAVDAAGGAA